MINDFGKYQIISNDYGAQITSTLFDDHEILYLSPLSVKNSPARGGIPVLFPQFANLGLLPKHGFARNLPWVKSFEKISSSEHSLQYSLTVGANFFTDWPYDALLELDSTINAKGFSQTLRVTNTGSQPFEWTGGLHPYLIVDDVCQIQVKGLCNTTYYDCHNPADKLFESEFLLFDEQPCEKLFDTAPNLIIRDKKFELVISTSGFSQWMIWNPGKMNNLADLPLDAWKSFICIEPVIVSKPNRLSPGETFVGEMAIKLQLR